MSTTAAVRYRFRATWRGQRRAWIALGAAAGVFYGAVLALAIGAQRADTVVERAARARGTLDIFAVPRFSKNGELLDFEAISAFPEVAHGFRLPLFPNSSPFDVAGIPDDPAFATSRLLAGRAPDPARAGEAIANLVARDRGVHVGDTIDVALFGRSWDFESEPEPGPVQRITIVGISADIPDFATAAGPSVFVTPAFVDLVAARAASFDLLAFELRRHDDDLPAFRRHISDLTGDKPVLFVEARNDYAQVQRSFHTQATVVRTVAGFLGVVIALALTQVFARLAWSESGDDATLAAIGLTRAHRAALAACRGLLIGLLAAVAAVGVAVVASAWMPLGRPGLAEPSPGVSAPGRPLAAGAAVTLLVVVLQNVAPLLRRRRPAARRSVAASAVQGFFGCAAGVGVRHALDRSGGGGGTPTRSGLGIMALAVAAGALTLTMSASLANLLDTPRLYGWGWDAAVDIDPADPGAARRLEQVNGVEAVGYGNGGLGIASIDGTAVEVLALDPGPVEPVLLEGRAPRAADEIVLGRKTLQAAGARLGGTVAVTVQGQQEPRRLRVTGVAVLPFDSDVSTLGEGALVTEAGLRAFVPELRPDTAFVRYVPGADPARLEQDLHSAASSGGEVGTPTPPRTLVDLGVTSVPWMVGALLLALGTTTATHVLVSSVRRRERELATLKALGFGRREIRVAVAWQGLALATAALAVGLPVGVAAGRWGWSQFANATGFADVRVTSAAPLLAVGAGALVLAAAVGVVAGRGPARTRAAVALRAE